MPSLSLLDALNAEYLQRHTAFESCFWCYYMGHTNLATELAIGEKSVDAFRTDAQNAKAVALALATETDPDLHARLTLWKNFFMRYSTSETAIPYRDRAIEIEGDILSHLSTEPTGYIDPETNTFVSATHAQMRLRMDTNDDERLRHACFDGRESSSPRFVREYVDLVREHNRFARAVGYPHFYEYKAQFEEHMSADAIITIFETLRHELAPVYGSMLDTLKHTTVDIRAPWNLNYCIAGDATIQDDPYFPLDTIIERWGRSFHWLGIDYAGASLTLDLLERPGKYNNGFCHMPVPVHYASGRRIPTTTNFTCNAIIGQVGSGYRTGATLFHEGGHAAHFANMGQRDIVYNTEYAPMSTAWAETQSMFFDSIFSSPEWYVRYARTLEGTSYPFSLYAKTADMRRMTDISLILRIAAVVRFEYEVHILPDDALSPERVCDIARSISQEYLYYSEPSLLLLTVPHIYSWQSACSYHGYGLATLALHQWRETLRSEYEFLVDNPHIGKIFTKTWCDGSTKTFPDFVQEVTGKPLSPDAYLQDMLMSRDAFMTREAECIEHGKEYSRQNLWNIDLGAHITLADGDTIIGTNENGFETMARAWREYLWKRR